MRQLKVVSRPGRVVGAAVVGLSMSGMLLAGAGPALAGAVPQAACVPTANPDAYQTPQDTVLTVDPIGVVTNDVLCGTDGLVISVTQPSHGTLDNNFDDSDGGFTYTPDPGYVGVDTFTYTLEDVQNVPAATVTITVTPMATTTSIEASSTTTSTVAATSTTAAPAAALAVTAAPSFTG